MKLCRGYLSVCREWLKILCSRVIQSNEVSCEHCLTHVNAVSNKYGPQSLTKTKGGKINEPQIMKQLIGINSQRQDVDFFFYHLHF